ncbi:MAG: PilZ domain-containing protein [Deltaproteobacteria bacterium]|nr:PilZ domain-containing protein [Deltaproteobacteria bacterium]
MVGSEEQMPESRRAARRAVDFACDLVAARWDRPVTSRCTDLSPFGMWLETTLPLTEEDSVVVSFTPPQRDREMTLFATVRHVVRDTFGMRSQAFGIGLEFENVTVFEEKILGDRLRGMPPRLPTAKRESGVRPIVAPN